MLARLYVLMAWLAHRSQPSAIPPVKTKSSFGRASAGSDSGLLLEPIFSLLRGRGGERENWLQNSVLAGAQAGSKSTAQVVQSEREDGELAQTENVARIALGPGKAIPYSPGPSLATALRADADVPAIRSMECGVNSTPPSASGSSPQEA